MRAFMWDEGTSYEFFVSLYVLQQPSLFGVRPSWAAGVRSRLPTSPREFIEKVLSFLPVPLCWLYLLPAEAKNIAGALYTLAQLNAAERLPSLLFIAETPIEAINILGNITLRQTWSSAEQEVPRAFLLRRGITPRPNTMNHLCEAWSDLTAAGEQFLQALTIYYQVFFMEQEERLRAPTVPHHHNALRLVDLEEITLHADEERGYNLRREALNEAVSSLLNFLTPDPE